MSDPKGARHVVRDHHVRHVETLARLFDEVVDHPRRVRIEPLVGSS